MPVYLKYTGIITLGENMLTVSDLLCRETMPTWNDISFRLYKDFSVQHLLNRRFEYHLVNGSVINVEFKEWAMKHLWSIQHIDASIDKNCLFVMIDSGLDISTFMADNRKRKKLLHYKDRIRMFACIYYIMKSGNLFYVKNGIIEGTRVKINYIRSKIISAKGVNVGMRLEEGVYVPLTVLIDTAINPYKTVEGLCPQKVFKLLIKENGKVIEEIYYDNYWGEDGKKVIVAKNRVPNCFRADTYSEKLKQAKLRNRLG